MSTDNEKKIHTKKKYGQRGCQRSKKKQQQRMQAMNNAPSTCA